MRADATRATALPSARLDCRPATARRPRTAGTAERSAVASASSTVASSPGSRNVMPFVPGRQHLGQHRTIVERAHRHAGAAEIGELHRQIEAGRRLVQAQPGIRHPDERGVVGGLEPHGAYGEAFEVSPRYPPLEVGSHVAAAGQQHREVGRGSVGAGPDWLVSVRSARSSASSSRSKSSSKVQLVGQRRWECDASRGSTRVSSAATDRWPLRAAAWRRSRSAGRTAPSP